MGVLPWGADVYDFIMLAGLFALFLFSYRKQARDNRPTGEVCAEGAGVNYDVRLGKILEGKNRQGTGIFKNFIR